MDFLKIRKKAKERAAGAAKGAKSGSGRTDDAPRTEAPPTEAHAEVPRVSLEPPADQVPTGEDVVDGSLASTLHGLPAAPEERFTTWRPGTREPPAFDEEPPRPRPEARADDFTIVSGLAAAAHVPSAPPIVAVPRDPVDPLDDFFYRPDEEAPDVPELGSPTEPATEEHHDGVAREEYLTFLLGKEEYAVTIGRVREVMKSPPITEVPRAPAHILGVVTVRGEVVPVFDPRRKLGLASAPAGDGSRVVIVDAGEGPCGLLVDTVASVVRLRPGSIEQPPQGLSAASADCLAGIGRAGDRLFMVLDLGPLLRRGPEPRRTRDGRVDAGA